MNRFLLLLTISLSADLLAAQRIITLSPSTTEMIYAIGGGNKIIASVEHADFPKQALTLPRIGNYQSINIEAILALKPDLIVAWPEGNPASQLALLEQLGVPIYYSYGNSLDALPKELEQLGAAIGNKAQASALAKRLQLQLQALRQQYKDKSKISLFYQVWPEPLMSVSNNNWLGESLLLCGADNIFANAGPAFPLVSVETVLIQQPQVIIAADQNPKVLSQWQDWPELAAVKQQHLFTIEPAHLHRFGPRLLLGIQELCEVLDKARQ